MERFECNKARSCKGETIVNPHMKVRYEYFKTQLCVKFKLGSCGYGSNCVFAHGVDDLRSSHRAKSFSARAEDRVKDGGNLCRMFYNGGQCAYGIRCRFRHVIPQSAKRARSDAISTKTGGSSGGDVTGFGNRVPVSKKIKLCNKWEISGSCKFGNLCCYAHGLAELAMPSAQIALGVRDASTDGRITVPQQKHSVQSAQKLEAQARNCISNKLQGTFIGIYADWIEDAQIGESH